MTTTRDDALDDARARLLPRGGPGPATAISRRGRLAAGDRIPPRTLEDIAGDPVPLPDPGGLVHLQLRRFAGCPVCNLHLQSIVRRHDEVLAAGVREVVVFHSTVEDLWAHAGDLPFSVIADPSKALYAAFGAEESRRALLDPQAWPAIIRGVLRTAWAVARRRRRAPSLVPHGGRYGLPADLLVDHNGLVVAAKYGEHADDQWSVDELLAHAWRRSAPVSR